MAKSKKGRLSGAARKEINRKASADAVEGRASGIAFARVIRMIGENHIRVAVASEHGYKEFMARIPNKFGKKGSTPLTINNVVSIYVGDDFDPDEVLPGKVHFDVTCILDDKQAYQLVKDGTIPAWMMKSPEDIANGVTKSTENEGEAFEFDYLVDGKTEENQDNKVVTSPVKSKPAVINENDEINIEDI